MKSRSSPSPTPTGDGSSPDIGRESRAGRTFDGLHLTQDPITEPNGTPALGSNSYVGVFPAKTSQSQDDAEDSQATDPACSSSSPESLTLFSPMGDGCSLRTYPDYFPATVDEISPSYSRRWPSSGFTTSPGECWTADTSECPSGAGAYSSLRDVLEAEVHPRFYLSQRAAAGILRRAEKGGRELPKALARALTELAQPKASPPDSATAAQTSPTPRRDGSSLRQPEPSPPQSDGTERPKPSSVRRLTPTECERLQAFPEGWTVP